MPNTTTLFHISKKTSLSVDKIIFIGKSCCWILLAFSLIATYFAWLMADNDVTIYTRTNFEFRTAEIDSAVRERFAAYELALRSGASLFNAFDSVTRTQWKKFASTMDLNTNYPGIQGLGYSPAIFPETKAQHISDVQAQGFPEYTIRPPGEREAYTPVIYLEPDTALNKKAFGFDTFSEATRRAAIEQARDTAKPTITGKITLVQEGTTNVQPGFIMFLAVYTTLEPPKTIEDRRKFIKGYVNAPFRMHNFMRNIINNAHYDVGFEVYDGTDIVEPALMYRSENIGSEHDRKPHAVFTATQQMELLGRPWTIRFATTEQFANTIDHRVPHFIATFGIVASLLLFVAARALLSSRVNIMMLAKAKKHESELLRGILDNFPMPYLLVDERQLVLKTNRRFMEMLEIDGAVENCYGKTLAEVYYQNITHKTIITESIAIGTIFQSVEVNTKSYKGQDKIILASISPLYDVNKACIGGLCIYLDLTERRQMEVKLARIGKMEAIGQLAAGIAHEINTPTQYVLSGITYIQSTFEEVLSFLMNINKLSMNSNEIGEIGAQKLQLMLEDIDFNFFQKEMPETMAQIFDGIERISSIVQAMRRFSHPSGEKMQPADICGIIRTTAEITRNEWKYVAEVDFDFPPDLPYVRCYQDEIGQALLNIIVNAAHAVADAVKTGQDQGKITICTRRIDDMVEITISDTGTGIPQEIHDHVFNMFFTTKEVGKGTGQGLAIAYDSVVNKHGGSLTFASEPGVGTTFFIKLPIAGPKSAQEG